MWRTQEVRIRTEDGVRRVELDVAGSSTLLTPKAAKAVVRQLREAIVAAER